MKMTAHGKRESAKRSGADWLGEVPADWAVKKMKYLFRDHSQKGRPNADLLSVTQDQGVVPRSWVENRMVMPSGALKTFKFIEKGDFAISLRSFEGGLEYCHHDGIISPAYTVLKAWHSNLAPGYYRYLFKSNAFISELQTSVVGIREGKNISFPELSHSLMPIPPVAEQVAIANFLDEKCAKVDEAVRIKEEQIALLRERRQILIQEAVTRGLNPNAPMKDSGIVWMGKIPVHWGVRKVKQFGKSRSGESIVNSQLSAAGAFEVYGGNGLMGFLDKYNVDGEYIVIGRVGAYCGNVRLARGRRWVSDNALILKVRNINSNYLAMALHAADLNRLSESNAQPLITGSKVSNLRVPYPPVNDQKKIAEFVEISLLKLDRAISIKESQIAALKEYKTTLINAAVTGKIKVT